MTAIDVVVGLIIIMCISESEICRELFLLFWLIVFLDFVMSVMRRIIMSSNEFFYIVCC